MRAYHLGNVLANFLKSFSMAFSSIPLSSIAFSKSALFIFFLAIQSQSQLLDIDSGIWKHRHRCRFKYLTGTRLMIIHLAICEGFIAIETLTHFQPPFFRLVSHLHCRCNPCNRQGGVKICHGQIFSSSAQLCQIINSEDGCFQ